MDLVLYVAVVCKSLVWQETEFAVKDTQVHGGYVLHVGVVEGTLSVGDKLSLLVDGGSDGGAGGCSGVGLVSGVDGVWLNGSGAGEWGGWGQSW